MFPLKTSNITVTLILTIYLRINPLSANPTKWSNTLKEFVGFYRRIVLWGWRLKGQQHSGKENYLIQFTFSAMFLIRSFK